MSREIFGVGTDETKMFVSEHRDKQVPLAEWFHLLHMDVSCVHP